MRFEPGNLAWNRTPVCEATLRRLYVDEGLTASQVADRLSVGVDVIYRRLRAIGLSRSNSEAHVGVQAGERNPNWRGGRRLSQGYVMVRTGPNSEVLEHRLVAEQMIGRSLTSDEVVHHRNGIKTDNRPENLEVLTQAEHMRRHASEGSGRWTRAALAAGEARA